MIGIKVSLPGTEACQDFRGVEGRRPGFRFRNRRSQFSVQRCPLFVVELVPIIGDLERYHGPFGQVGGLVHHQTTISNVCFQRLHGVVMLALRRFVAICT